LHRFSGICHATLGLKVQTLDVNLEPTSQEHDCRVCFSLRHGLLQTDEAGLVVTKLISNLDLHTKSPVTW
jgi:hypothetical protein